MSKNIYFQGIFPFIYLFILLLSKEIISYDNEKIVILCILSFLILAYKNGNDIIFDNLRNRGQKIKEEFSKLLEYKIFILTRLRYYWRIFLDCEDNLTYIYMWVRAKIKNIQIFRNENRSFFISFSLIDQLTTISKEHFIMNSNSQQNYLGYSILSGKHGVSDNSNKFLQKNLLQYFNQILFLLNIEEIIFFLTNKRKVVEEILYKKNINLISLTYIKLFSSCR